QLVAGRRPGRRRTAGVPGRDAGARLAERRAASVHLYRALTRVHRRRDVGVGEARSDRTIRLTDMSLIAVVSVLTAGFTVAIGAGLAALAEGRAVAQGLLSIAQQPDETNAISRAMFVGLAMIETSGIYCFVVSLILIFANPFWDAV